MKTSENLQIQMFQELTLSAEDSPVRTSVPQGRALVLPEKGLDYGGTILGLLGQYDPDSRSWKTLQLCFGGDWEEFSETWPRSGMTVNGIAYQLPSLVPLTKGTESGLLPTPTAHNAKEGAYPAEFTRNTPTLAAQVGGKLNPEFVEWMMGLPIGHTALNLLETQLYLSSRKSSEGQS